MKRLSYLLLLCLLIYTGCTPDSRSEVDEGSIAYEDCLPDRVSEEDYSRDFAMSPGEDLNAVQEDGVRSRGNTYKKAPKYFENVAIIDQWEQEPQRFELDPNKDWRKVVDDNFRISIDKGSLKRVDGKEIKGMVDLYCRTYHSRMDFLKAGLVTKAGDKPLESGGMLEVRAFNEGVEVTFAEGKNMELEIRSDNFKPDMKLFSGVVEKDEITNNNAVDWSINTDAFRNKWDEVDFYEYGSDVKFLEPCKQCPTGVKPVSKPLKAKKLKLPGRLADTPMKFTFSQEEMFARIVYNKSGTVNSINPIGPAKKLLSKLMPKELNKLSIQQAIIEGEEDTATVALEALYKVQMVKEADDYPYSPEGGGGVIMFEPVVSEGNPKAMYMRTEKIQQDNDWVYSFTVPNFGWMNCDRFVRYREFEKLIVATPQEKLNTNIAFVVFNDYKAMMRLQPEALTWTNGTIATGQKATAIIIEEDEATGSFTLATRRFVTGKGKKIRNGPNESFDRIEVFNLKTVGELNASELESRIEKVFI